MGGVDGDAPGGRLQGMRDASSPQTNVSIPAMAWLAAVLFWGALLGFALMSNGYSGTADPVALLGARVSSHALAFNVVAYLVPGLLLAITAWRWRAAMPDDSAWTLRIGMRLALLSALAFALQGLFPLAPEDMAAMASRGHVTAWSLWWVAYVPAALLVAVGMLRQRGRRRDLAATSMAVAGLAGALVVGWLALASTSVLAPGVAERLMLLVWFGWWLLVVPRTAG